MGVVERYWGGALVLSSARCVYNNHLTFIHKVYINIYSHLAFKICIYIFFLKVFTFRFFLSNCEKNSWDFHIYDGNPH